MYKNVKKKKGIENLFIVALKWFLAALKLRRVDLNYNSECD